jgi:hypothetical protein
VGYTTDFDGRFNLNKKLDEKTYIFLKKLAETRRMARNVDPKYGVEGEFYIDGSEGSGHGQGDDANIVDYNRPPSTQPSLWLQWIPTDDRIGFEWDGGEKFHGYVAWLKYIIDKILLPKGYILNGRVHFQGEATNDFGYIVVINNVVTIDRGRQVYDSDSEIEDTYKIIPEPESKAKPVVISHKRKISWKGAQNGPSENRSLL